MNDINDQCISFKRKIGTGGHAVVFLGELNHSHKVALKVFTKSVKSTNIPKSNGVGQFRPQRLLTGSIWTRAASRKELVEDGMFTTTTTTSKPPADDYNTSPISVEMRSRIEDENNQYHSSSDTMLISSPRQKSTCSSPQRTRAWTQYGRNLGPGGTLSPSAMFLSVWDWIGKRSTSPRLVVPGVLWRPCPAGDTSMCRAAATINQQQATNGRSLRRRQPRAGSWTGFRQTSIKDQIRIFPSCPPMKIYDRNKPPALRMRDDEVAVMQCIPPHRNILQ